MKLAWLTNRIGTRGAIAVVLVAISALLAMLASLGLARTDAGRIDARLDDRAVDIAAAVAGTTPDSVEAVIEALVTQDGVRSISVFDPASQTVIASSAAPSGRPLSLVSDPELRLALEAASSGQPVPDAASTRVVGPVAARSLSGASELSVLIEFDRTEVGADLATARRNATIAMIAALAVVAVAGYGVAGVLVTRRARRIALRVHEALGDSSISKSRDELGALEAAIAGLVSTREPANGLELALASRLPAMWIQLDSGLHVVDSRAQFDDGPGPVALGLSRLDDLLSDSIVEVIGQLVAELAPGESQVFGFTVGHREYRAELACHDADTFELAIAEDEMKLDERSMCDIARSEAALDRLLGELPFTLIELDGRGVVQWASGPYLGVEADELAGRKLTDLAPSEGKPAVRDAIRTALVGEGPARFALDLETPVNGVRQRWSHTVIDWGTSAVERLLVAAIEVPVVEQAQVDLDAKRQLDEQLWNAELRISDLEAQLEQHRAREAALRGDVARAETALAAARGQIVEPAMAVVRASLGLNSSATPAPEAVDALKRSVEQLATAIDSEFGTTLIETIETGVEPAAERFHLATFLDEIAIARSKGLSIREARIDVQVQPSLPRWLHGNVAATRAAIHQMIEIARMVASDRLLVLAARQDTSAGRSVQVRFEVQIPTPQLDEGALDVVRGCLAGDPLALSDSLAELQQAATLPDFNPLDIELVTVEDQATVLRCTNAFDVADEPESDHSWVRGLRTLIVQDPSQGDNGIQSSLGAFGIIGYVVSDERALIEALRVAEEYSNPYRFVLADVDTPNLESFIGQLFDGDAPVVLVGRDSESAMVAALSAGYAGYLAKPVRQVDLLEVILSTVEPPTQQRESPTPATVA